MKIHFEQIGRNNKTFDAQIDDALIAKCGLNPKSKNRYGDECILCALCDEYNFLCGQVRGCMMGTPDFNLSKDGKRIGVFAGWHRVDEAWLVRDGKGGAENPHRQPLAVREALDAAGTKPCASHRSGAPRRVHLKGDEAK